MEETGGKPRSTIWNQYSESMTRVRKNLDRNKAMKYVERAIGNKEQWKEGIKTEDLSQED